MVKSLRFFAHSCKWLVLLLLLMLLGLGIWLHQAERSLGFAKPWISRAVNAPDAPYVVTFDDVTIDWTNVTMLGKLRIKNIAFANREGSVFAQFPEVFATIDPIGFLPDRRLLHRVMLRQPHMFMTRNADGAFEFGFENAPSRMPLDDLLAFFAGSDDNAPVKAPSLPFRDFIIDDATFTFTDEQTQTSIVSEAFDFQLKRHQGVYDAILSMPFMVDAEPVMLSAGVRALPKTREHVLAVQFKSFPMRLVCLFGSCPEGIAADGDVNGNVAVGIGDADLSPRGFVANLATNKALVTLPELFAEPLKLGDSSVKLQGDWSKHVVTLTQAKIQLEDTSILASANVHKGEDGWYVKADASCGTLDIQKLYKYWPLTMAPDSRKWITGKLKSGMAANGKLKLNLTPADFAADYFSDASVDATAEARGITFEYLPGFPPVEKMDGTAHFTATTVKVEGGGGILLDGTKVEHAVLWCPELHKTNNPMETTLKITAPASDAVTMLALKHFPFDDDFGLDAKNIKGTVSAAMELKFNAFSDKPSSSPDEIHLDAVDYDISATMHNVAQMNVAGGYDVRALNGTLKADTGGLSFDGSLMLGESEINDVKLSQPSGKALSLSVKGRPVAGATSNASNDFDLTYQSGEIPAITLRGKRLDASISYDNKEHSSLAEFPAMKLDVDVGELLLAADTPFTDVKGKLYCTKARCESADFVAQAGKASITATISPVNGKRQFFMKSSNAGSVLKALDITDRMTGGEFEMRGDYNDALSPPKLDARMIFTDFTLKNSQILGRIFSIGSLTGLANALTGSGIAFEKMAANLTSHAGLITVSKGMGNGASMGITFAGTVDTRTSKLDLKGVVAPAYALNSILGKIPLIGILAGGEGEGLIAFNYWVKGTYAEPDVGVNPLSGLTPGFLRGIFSGFEGSSDKSDPSAPSKPYSNVRRP